MRKKIAVALLLLCFHVFCLPQEGTKIRIVVYDLDPKNMKKDEAALVSDFLRSELAKMPVFEIVSRNQLNKQYDELKLQLTGITSDSDKDRKNRIKYGEMLNVKKAIVGTVGKAFGKIIINIQLYDMETGKIIFAENSKSTEDTVYDDLRELSRRIADNATGNVVKIEIKDIEMLIDSGNYEKAKEKLDAYMRQSGINQKTKDLQALINKRLAEEKYKKSREMYNNNLLKNAKDYIVEAMQLDPYNNRYKDFSNQINNRIQELDSQEIIQKQKEEDRRQADEKNRQFWSDLFSSHSSGGEDSRIEYMTLFNWAYGSVLYPEVWEAGVLECSITWNFVSGIPFGGLGIGTKLFEASGKIYQYNVNNSTTPGITGYFIPAVMSVPIFIYPSKYTRSDFYLMLEMDYLSLKGFMEDVSFKYYLMYQFVFELTPNITFPASLFLGMEHYTGIDINKDINLFYGGIKLAFGTYLAQ